jgi:hypothetical protein
MTGGLDFSGKKIFGRSCLPWENENCDLFGPARSYRVPPARSKRATTFDGDKGRGARGGG